MPATALPHRWATTRTRPVAPPNKRPPNKRWLVFGAVVLALGLIVVGIAVAVIVGVFGQAPDPEDTFASGASISRHFQAGESKVVFVDSGGAGQHPAAGCDLPSVDDDSVVYMNRFVDAWCWLYAVTAPAIAGALMWFGIGTTEGGGDFCDPVYTEAAARDADYRTASLFIAAGSALMLACGVLLLVNLARRRQSLVRFPRVRLTLGVVVVCVAMAGYGFILVVGSDFSSDCGGVRL